MIINDIKTVIWNTPLFLIDEKIHKIPWLEIYAKLEFLNPFGSVKDRTAMGLLEEVWDEKYIIESSSWNTAKALWILASVSWKKLLDISRKMHQQEVEDIIKIVWVDIKSLPAGSECPDPNDPNSPLEVIKRIMKENPGKYFYTDQFWNEWNPRIHEKTTAPEIEKDIWTPDFFFAWLWTTGSSKWVQDYFKNKWDMKTIWIVTAWNSHLPWIRNSQEMFEVWLFKPELYEDFCEVNEQEAIDSMLVLVKQCWLIVWPTSWATFHWMLEYFKKQNPETLKWKKAVFIACDRLEPYTWYLREKRKSLFENENENKKVELDQNVKISHVNEINLNSNDEILVDMRSYASYEIAHIKWSLSLPFEDLRKYLANDYLPFPKESKIIFICPYGEESELLAQMATKIWYNASSLEKGFLQYKDKNPQNIISYIK